jgi:hypothetical protein
MNLKSKFFLIYRTGGSISFEELGQYRVMNHEINGKLNMVRIVKGTQQPNNP